MINKHYNASLYIILSLIIILLSGCSSFGSQNVPTDRFNYNAAIAKSRNEQMLLNIIRIRYLDVPDFLAVSSVITSYSYEGKLGAAGTTGGGVTDNIYTGNINLGYAAKPTITYSPLAGQEFNRRMMKEIPPESLFSLGHSGWPLDVLAQIGITRINDVQNMGFSQVPAPGGQPGTEQLTHELQRLENFQNLLQFILRLKDAGVMELQRQKVGDTYQTYMIIDPAPPEKHKGLVKAFKQLLKLDDSINSYRITNRLTGRTKDEITIHTRSLLAIMSFLSRGIQIPDEDMSNGLVVKLPDEIQAGISKQLPFTVHSQKESPKDPYVAVKYRNYWFYINHTDINSKRTFATIQLLFQLQAPSTGAAAPLLTLPTGQ